MLIPFLIEEMSKIIISAESVNVGELDSLIKSHNIPMREDHRSFLIKYGNCRELLIDWFGNFTFERFKEFYLDESPFDEDRLPVDNAYIGTDFSDEFVCIDYKTGAIQSYFDQEKDIIYYNNLESLLFTCFLRSDYPKRVFDKISSNVEISNPKSFLKENDKHRVYEIQDDNYYLIGNKLYVIGKHIYETDYKLLNICKMKHRFIMANIYEGGVIDDYLQNCKIEI